MALNDVSIHQNQTTFTLRVDGEPCYSEECSGCCGSADTFLTRAELETLRERISDALDPTRHDSGMTQQEYMAKFGG